MRSDSGRKKRAKYSPYKEMTVMVQKILEAKKKSSGPPALRL